MHICSGTIRIRLNFEIIRVASPLTLVIGLSFEFDIFILFFKSEFLPIKIAFNYVTIFDGNGDFISSSKNRGFISLSVTVLRNSVGLGFQLYLWNYQQSCDCKHAQCWHYYSNIIVMILYSTYLIEFFKI